MMRFDKFDLKMCIRDSSCRAGQNLHYQIGHRHFAAHEANAVFFRLFCYFKAFHTSRGEGAAQRFIFPFAHVGTSIARVVYSSLSRFPAFEKWVLRSVF